MENATNLWDGFDGGCAFVAMLDLDFFKKLNDTYSHVAGDQVLKVFSREVEGHLRECDLFGRMGGEEFLLVLPVTESAQAETILERVRESIAQLVVAYEGHELMVTVSIGFAEWKKGHLFKDAVKQADIALYDAKDQGRDRVVYRSNAS